MPLLDSLKAFISPLEKNNIEYFVTGSVASIFYGEPRLTHDVDIVVHLSQKDLLVFSSFFPLEEFYCPPDEVIQVENKRRPFGHYNLIHHETGFKADIYPDTEDRLHRWAFQKRRRMDIANNLTLWLAPPEYVVIRKLEYYGEGGSEKHLQDIKAMLPAIDSSVDVDFLEKEISIRNLDAFWELIKGC